MAETVGAKRISSRELAKYGFNASFVPTCTTDKEMPPEIHEAVVEFAKDMHNALSAALMTFLAERGFFETIPGIRLEEAAVFNGVNKWRRKIEVGQ